MLCFVYYHNHQRRRSGTNIVFVCGGGGGASLGVNRAMGRRGSNFLNCQTQRKSSCQKLSFLYLIIPLVNGIIIIFALMIKMQLFLKFQPKQFWKYHLENPPSYQKQSTIYHIFKMIKNYQFLSTIICTLIKDVKRCKKRCKKAVIKTSAGV